MTAGAEEGARPLHVGLISRGEINYTLDLAGDLVKSGVRVTVYLPFAHVAREVGTDVDPGARLFQQGLLDRSCQLRLTHLPRMRDPRSARVFHRLAKTIRGDGVDVAHVLFAPDEIWYGVLAWFLRGIPVVTTLTVPTPHPGGRISRAVEYGATAIAVRGSDRVIVSSRDHVADVTEWYGVDASRIACVPLDTGESAVKWSDPTVREEPHTVLFFGRAAVHKGLENLVRSASYVAREIPDVLFLLCAHGEQLDACRDLIQDPSRFEVHDEFVPGDVKAKFFQRSSLVALPYIAAASSGVLMTAYAFSKPVVASDIDGLREYVTPGVTGVLVPPRDVEGLARGIIEALAEPGRRREMGNNARRWMSDRRTGIARQTLRTYREAITTRGVGG